MDQEEIIRQLEKNRAGSGCPDISLAADFNPGRLFQLYVGVAGIVKCVDVENNVISRIFVVGYHPIPLRKVLSSANGTTATDLGAAWI